MFACTGLWNAFFLFIYAVTDASKLMKWCTRSTTAPLTYLLTCVYYQYRRYLLALAAAAAAAVVVVAVVAVVVVVVVVD